MDHINAFLKEHGQPYGYGAYPRTDDLMARTIALSVGVVDAGLGAGFGVNVLSSDEEIEAKARQLVMTSKLIFDLIVFAKFPSSDIIITYFSANRYKITDL